MSSKLLPKPCCVPTSCYVVMKVAHVELLRASDEKKKLLEAEREILQRSLNDSSESPRPNRMKIMMVSPPAAAS